MPPRLLSVPHIPQRGESDCLAACAGMLLAASGLTVPHDRLVRLLRTAEWGAPRSNLHSLQRLSPDLSIVIKQGDVGDLSAELDAGFAPILFVYTADLPYWTRAAFHAVVLVGEDERHFYLNDPAFPTAPQVTLRGDLELAWIEVDTHYALIYRSR